MGRTLVGMERQEVRRLARVLEDASDDLNAIRRRCERVATDVGVGAVPGELASLARWLADAAVDARRRAFQIEGFLAQRTGGDVIEAVNVTVGSTLGYALAVWQGAVLAAIHRTNRRGSNWPKHSKPRPGSPERGDVRRRPPPKKRGGGRSTWELDDGVAASMMLE